MIPPGRGGLAGGTVIPSRNPLGVLRRDHHAVKRHVISSSLREGKPWLIKTRAEDALQPWSADRRREGSSDKKTDTEAGCTESMAHNGSATQPRDMDGSDEREEEEEGPSRISATLRHKHCSVKPDLTAGYVRKQET